MLGDDLHNADYGNSEQQAPYPSSTARMFIAYDPMLLGSES